MQYKTYKDFLPSLRDLKQKGSHYQKTAGRITAIIGGHSIGETDPLSKIKRTNHGETRIKKCLKYDFTDGVRLVTIRDNGIVLFCFTGDHDSCDKWLNQNRGMTMIENKDGQITITLMGTANGLNGDNPIGNSALTVGKLFEGIIPESYFDSLIVGIPRNVIRGLESLESINDESDIYNLVQCTDDINQSQTIFDVFCLLRRDKREEAIDRIKLYLGEVKPVEKLTKEEIAALADSNNIKNVKSDDPHFQEVFEHFVSNASYMDWMLYLHPDQQKIVDTDYSAPSKLLGVSGSGKTCIVVQRAIRLAEKYTGEKILILTLNRQLASLIEEMVNSACRKEFREAIYVVPFFKLCQDMLNIYEPNNKKIYDDLTWKSKEHIDEVWREFYRCELNVDDAKVLAPVHDSLISRGVFAEQYIREEFDWIRSAVPKLERQKYVQLERTGRNFPLDKNYRKIIIQGLEYWENKMLNVGITDYLGLSTALYKHIEKIKPKYRSILIDESQDFGTIEYNIIRKLANKVPNDLFFCGDAAQQVSAKHRSFKEADISIHSSRTEKVLKNYRNSREILKAASDVLVENLSEDLLESGDFEILNPEYANFSAAPPLLLKADSLEKEIAYAIALLKEELESADGKKGCVAICGYSLYQIKVFGEQHNIKVLDGTLSIGDDYIYMSDLEHTKGFEFETVIIVNCNKGILPDNTKPENEQFRELARFYVAMTRAKTQLVVSYSTNISPLLATSVETNFVSENWDSYIGEGSVVQFGKPSTLEEIRNKDATENTINSKLDQSGIKFLYTRSAIGLSALLIDKLRTKITGGGLLRSGIRVEWTTLSQAKKDTDIEVKSRQAFGPEGIVQFRELVKKINKKEASESNSKY